MVRSVVKTLTVVAILLPGLTAAEPSKSQLKSGLWNLTVGADDAPSVVMHSQICIAGPLKPEELLEGRRPAAAQKSNCTTVRRERTDDGLVREVKCAGPDHTFHSLMTMKISEKHVDATVVSEMDKGPQETVRQGWDWAGSCPSGMKVGQLLIQRPPIH